MVPQVFMKGVNAEHYKYTALTLAAINNYAQIVEALVNAGANMDMQNKSGNTALIFAAKKNHHETVEILVNAGANLDIQNNKKNTALILAVKKRHIQIVKILLSAGADVNIENKDNGCTALNFYSSYKIKKLLKKAGAKRSKGTCWTNGRLGADSK